MKKARLITSIFTVILALIMTFAEAAEDSLSSYLAYVGEVIDGDSLYVYVPVWAGIVVKAHIRLFGLDSPEIHGKCSQEKELALKAQAKLKEWLPKNSSVQLFVMKEKDKYGRVLANIRTPDGTSITKRLIDEGLARVYNGKGKRQGWCNKEKKIERKEKDDGD